jgi:hypothetical protein
MTDEEIILEVEAIFAFRGESLKKCPCGMETHIAICPVCDTRISGDTLADELQRRAEAGEDVDLSLLDPRLSKQKDTFAPLAPGETP